MRTRKSPNAGHWAVRCTSFYATPQDGQVLKSQAFSFDESFSTPPKAPPPTEAHAVTIDGARVPDRNSTDRTVRDEMLNSLRLTSY